MIHLNQLRRYQRKELRGWISNEEPLIEVLKEETTNDVVAIKPERHGSDSDSESESLTAEPSSSSKKDSENPVSFAPNIAK